MDRSSRQRAQTWPYPRSKVFTQSLRQAATAWFLERAYTTDEKRPYCLDKWDNWRKNIILPEVADYIAETKKMCNGQSKPFPLHKFIHHGLSSQAMIFNLLGPLVVKNDIAPLLEACKAADVAWAGNFVQPEFEYEDRDIFGEDTGQPTSIDFVLKDQSGRPNIFIESKLVESEFGGCSVFAAGDCDGQNPADEFSQCYLHHIGRRYWSLLEEYGFTSVMRSEKQCVLAHHYQFFREVIFALKHDGVFVLLSDERSPVFHCTGNGRDRGLMPFLIQFVPESVKCKVTSISIQSLVKTIKQTGRHSWISEFERKYGLLQSV